MEYISREIRKVHTVRPRFIASEPLSMGVENFMQTGVTAPRFLFSSSKYAIVDHEEFFDKKFLEVRANVTRKLKAHHEKLTIEPRVSIKLLGSGALRFQIMPVDQVVFQDILDTVDTLPQYNQGFIGPQRHFLHVTIAASQLGSREDMGKAAKSLRERLVDTSAGQLYTVQAHDLIDGNAEMLVNTQDTRPANTL